MPACPQCCAPVQEGASFCPACGTSLASPTSPVTPSVSSTYTVPKTSGKAMASLICGFFFFFLPATVAAIILGHISHYQIRRSGGRLKGQGLAVTGLVLGYLGVLLLPVWLILAAIAIPSFLRSRIAANEARAITTLRTYNAALLSYAGKCPSQGYPASVTNLGPGRGDCAHANLVDSRMAASLPNKNGYLFFYMTRRNNDAGQVIKYTINADPASANFTGIRHFFVDETGIVRVATDAPATPNSPPVQ
jgi:hypothetical protein